MGSMPLVLKQQGNSDEELVKQNRDIVTWFCQHEFCSLLKIKPFQFTIPVQDHPFYSMNICLHPSATLCM